jgi:hypothetical protein
MPNAVNAGKPPSRTHYLFEIRKELQIFQVKKQVTYKGELRIALGLSTTMKASFCSKILKHK